METIRTYLDNMFAGLPKTAQMKELKDNIYANMEDKYNELKREGRSEHEIIGIVISEFGNIDELIDELGIEVDSKADTSQPVTREEVYSYMAAKKQMGKQVSFAVFLCILAAACIILVNQLMNDNYIAVTSSIKEGGFLSIIPALLLITIAVAIFIYSGTKFEQFKYMEDRVILPAGLKLELQQKYHTFLPYHNRNVIIAISMMLLSPIAIFVSNMIGGGKSYGVVILLGIVSIALLILLPVGVIKESYGKLLQLEDYTPKNEPENRVIAAVAIIIWPLATCAFLISGLVFHLWYINWLIYPVTGMLFGSFCAVYSVLTKKKSEM